MFRILSDSLRRAATFRHSNNGPAAFDADEFRRYLRDHDARLDHLRRQSSQPF